MIAPNGNDDMATDFTYSSFLGLSTIDTPDTSASMSCLSNPTPRLIDAGYFPAAVWK